MDLAAFCRAIPKVELHVHLLGAIRLDTLAEMAQRQLAGYAPEEVADLARRDAKPKGVLHILRALEQRILRGPEDLHRIAYEYLEDAASQGVRHAEIFWNPTGTARDSGPLGMSSQLPFRIGAPNLGGALTTRGGLTFIAAAQDNYLRAIDTETGKVLWRARLGAGGQATPMTYRSPASGRQFVAVSAGGHYFLNTTKGDYIYAFALPRKR